MDRDAESRLRNRIDVPLLSFLVCGAVLGLRSGENTGDSVFLQDSPMLDVASDNDRGGESRPHPTPLA